MCGHTHTYCVKLSSAVLCSEHDRSDAFGLGIIVKLNLREIASLSIRIKQLQITQPVHGAGIVPTARGLYCFHILKQKYIGSHIR